MILAQISDTHIDEAETLVYGHFDTSSALSRAIEVLNAMDPQPDLVLHTGDIASHGSVSRYRRFVEIMAALDAPYAVIPGNHDERAALSEVLGGTPALPTQGDFLHYTIDDLPVRIICCDSVIQDETPGELCAARLTWLEEQLDADPARPTIIALHHPPFYTGMTGTTAKGLKNGGKALADLVRRHSQVVRVLAGHVHRPITTSFGGTLAFACPTTCYPFGLDTGPERELNVVHEPPGIGIHLWLEDASPDGADLVSHVLPVGDWPEPITLLRGGVRVIDT